MSTISIKDITEKAKTELTSLTGFVASSVVSVRQDSASQTDGGKTWNVLVELLERPGIPDRMDILGIYEAHLDAEGNLVGYERKGLRKRGDTAGQEITEEE
jgi:hypothetical protein